VRAVSRPSDRQHRGGRERGAARERSSSAATRIRRLPTAALTAADISAIRALLWRSFPPGEEGFTEDDWQHSLGGTHFRLEHNGRLAGHASVVERVLHLGPRQVRTGYVEAVAIDPDDQRRGLGTRLMRDVTAFVRDQFDLGALGTGSHRFYERLGWRTWRGRSRVRLPDGTTRATPDEDGYILVLETPSSPVIDLDDPIACEWRPGDVW
jgi:aminoglycoside 2'-N-acetyltransferase I